MPKGPEKEYQVTELTQYIRLLLEENQALQGIWVGGEISNLTKHSSGHVYFTLKEQDAQITVVMFRSSASQYPDFPGNGSKAQVFGDITVYPARGNYQLIAKRIKAQGIGDLYRQFLDRKEKLEKEGLFDASHKKKIPPFPTKIGLATSPTGAVIRDIIATIRRRFPHVELLLSPTVVQGDAGSVSTIQSIEKLSNANVDLIILARGGGSIEDLWCFNDEALARKIFECKVPIISAIGHETDFTIADFVADRRAATPTAAAEIAVPDSREIRKGIDDISRVMEKNLRYYVDFRRQILDDAENRMLTHFRNRIERNRAQLEKFETQFLGLDMNRVLERGYTITLKNGKALRSPEKMKQGEVIETIFSKGRAQSLFDKEVKDER